MFDARDKCGVVAAYASDGSDVAPVIYNGLMGVQHRGQEFVGVATFDVRVHHYIKPGLVINVLTNDVLDLLPGNMAVGHVRYSTEGSSTLENAQPMKVSLSKDSRYEIYFGFNGNVPHYDRLVKKLSSRYQLRTNNDAEGLALILLEGLENKDDIFAANQRLMKTVPGAYSYTALLHDKDKNETKVIAARDSYGIKPLCYGKKDGLYAIASETLALRFMGIDEDFARDVRPGEVIVLDQDGARSQIVAEFPTRHCYFEYTYFASVASKIDDVSVSSARERLGKLLAKMYPIDADIVIGSPESGKGASEGYSSQSRIPKVDAIIRNSYIPRTFIMPNQTDRKKYVKLKFIFDRANIEGRDVVLVDDSVVRATTITDLVYGIRHIGKAVKVHVRISTPPIKSMCDWGIAFRTKGELIANRCKGTTLDDYNEFMKEITGADSFGYMSIEGLTQAIGLGDDSLCLACLTGVEPYEITTY